VVLKPKTYLELLKLDVVMHTARLPSKLGIERRPIIKGLYGAYFYHRGIELALELRDKHFDNTAIVKRGCTEMERKHGRSDKWEVQSWQPKLEYYLDEMIYSHKQPDQSDAEKNKIRDKWKKFAWKFDPTFEGELYPEIVLY